MLKVFFCLLLSGMFIISAFADLEYEDVYEKLSSKNPIDRAVALHDLRQTADKRLHQKIIIMALMDPELEVRTKAESTLNNLLIRELRGDTVAVNRNGLSDIFFSLNLYPEVQLKLMRKATDHWDHSDIVRDRSESILLFSDPKTGYLVPSPLRVLASEA